MLDENLTKQNVNELFLEVNKDSKDDDSCGENPPDELVRYEFVELLIRIADYKYMRKGEVQLYAQAFGKLFTSVIEPWYREETSIWGNFR